MISITNLFNLLMKVFEQKPMMHFISEEGWYAYDGLDDKWYNQFDLQTLYPGFYVYKESASILIYDHYILTTGGNK